MVNESTKEGREWTSVITKESRVARGLIRAGIRAGATGGLFLGGYSLTGSRKSRRKKRETRVQAGQIGAGAAVLPPAIRGIERLAFKIVKVGDMTSDQLRALKPSFFAKLAKDLPESFKKNMKDGDKEKGKDSEKGEDGKKDKEKGKEDDKKKGEKKKEDEKKEDEDKDDRGGGDSKGKSRPPWEKKEGASRRSIEELIRTVRRHGRDSKLLERIGKALKHPATKPIAVGAAVGGVTGAVVAQQSKKHAVLTADGKEPDIPEKVREIADAIRRDDPKASDEKAYKIAWSQYKETQKAAHMGFRMGLMRDVVGVPAVIGLIRRAYQKMANMALDPLTRVSMSSKLQEAAAFVVRGETKKGHDLADDVVASLLGA